VELGRFFGTGRLLGRRLRRLGQLPLEPDDLDTQLTSVVITTLSDGAHALFVEFLELQLESHGVIGDSGEAAHGSSVPITVRRPHVEAEAFGVGLITRMIERATEAGRPVDTVVPARPPPSPPA
jgi:hypothetical protein